MIMRYFIVFALLCSPAVAQSIVISGGGGSIVLSGSGGYQPESPSVPPTSVQEDLLKQEIQSLREELAKQKTVSPPVVVAPVQRTAVVSPQYRSQWPPTWNVNGDWNASREKYLNHLRNNANHKGKFWQSYPLETWTRGQLAALHDDDHVHRVRRLDVYPVSPESSGSGVTYQSVSKKQAAPLVLRQQAGCPNGQCPLQPVKSAAAVVQRVSPVRIQQSGCPGGVCPTRPVYQSRQRGGRFFGVFRK